jgi:ABC-type lipoprotein release transport system permease subunit
MTPRQLVLRALRFYWRSNLAVVGGVATAVAVLAGALLVGDSVRGSLRDLVLTRLGRMDRSVTSTGFFREALAGELAGDPIFTASYAGIAPLIVLQGVATEPSSGRRVSRVAVYGVDDRFWRFHGLPGRSGPAARDGYASRALAADLGAAAGGTLLIRIERPSAIPIDSLHGRKENPGRTLRLTLREVLDADQMGEFSMQAQQGSVRAVFVPLAQLQKDLDEVGRINAMLVADGAVHQGRTLGAAIRQFARLEDFGLKLRTLDSLQAIVLEADAGLLDRRRTAAAEQAAATAGLRAKPVLTYLANTLRTRDHVVPYSLVAAVDLQTLAKLPAQAAAPPTPSIVINDWTARDLGARVGDSLTLEYYVWQEPGNLDTKSATFRVAGIVPIAGPADDRDLSPSYPGITDADTLGDWDPPFPIDLKRVRPADEDYWKRYRTTPKAFVDYAAGAKLWASQRFGDRTSMRIYPRAGERLDEAAHRFQVALLSALDPAAGGLTIAAVRQQNLAASAGATDFGEYFVYFSFFLVVSALILAALFFRLGVEQRAREVGLLRAVGFGTPRVRRLFTAEGLLLAVAGSILGAAGAIGYAALMMTGLRTWWSGAVGTSALTLHVSAASLAGGAAGALVAAVFCIWWALRELARLSERDLLAGRLRGSGSARRRSIGVVIAAGVLALTAIALVVAASTRTIGQAGAFFGAGSALLAAGLCATMAVLRRPPRSVEGQGAGALVRIGWRNATERPGRSVLAIAVIAAAAFIVMSVDAFRRGDVDVGDRRSGTGGFALLVNLDLPLVHDPNGRDGREALGIADQAGVSFTPFRVMPGEDASCLNLYQPVSPTILGAAHGFVDAGRFAFQESLATSEADRANPWRLLEASQPDATIPVIADANSMTYVLHKSLGGEILFPSGDRTLRLKLVAALADSVLQGELVMSDANFTSLFPGQPGYRFLLVDVPAARADQIGAAIEKGAADFGADAVSTKQRLNEYHAVENTYLSTFQTLGGLGLLVGTIGLAAVLLRNVLERQRELALLRAVGYRPTHLFAVIVSENALLLACGLALGAGSAAIAVGPAAMARGARLPISGGGLLLLVAVLAAGLISSILATRVALRAPLVAVLRTE